MIYNNTSVWNSPVRTVSARVELFEGSTLASSHTNNDAIKEFTIQRIGDESKFFGFGVCQRLNLHLVDTNRELNYGTQHSIKCYLNAGQDLDAFPQFKITEVHRDENTNELSITAYDALYEASNHTVSELGLEPPYTIDEVVKKISNALGLSESYIGDISARDVYDMNYPEGANLEGTETFREVLDAIAEVAQAIYFVRYDNALAFITPSKDSTPVLTIGKEDYITLDSKTNRRLSDICSATELGNNIITESGTTGTIQYVRDNPFWELREDITTLLDAALVRVGGLTINQFSCSWRGNPCLEVADKIALVTKDNETVISFVLNDVIEYNGSLKQKTSWAYSGSDTESLDNPVSLGDTLKKTYAQVDKANAKIEIVAGETATIKLDNQAIQATVTQLDNNMADVISQVNTKATPEDVTITVQQVMAQGVEAVTTATGFTFNQDGLHVSKTDSEITTSITEDGMTVSRENREVLKADNLGVKAEDLHATTFLIIGENSRFEDYGSRTGCFWIGG